MPVILERAGGKSRAIWHSGHKSAKRLAGARAREFACGALGVALAMPTIVHNHAHPRLPHPPRRRDRERARIVVALGRPWYAPRAQHRPERDQRLGDINGPLNDLFHGMQRWVTGDGGTTGWDALDSWGVALAAMAGIAAHRRAGLPRSGAAVARPRLLRYSALAAVAITLWKLLDPPGTNAAMELRLGALIGAGCAACCSSASALRQPPAAPLRRTRAARALRARRPPAGPPSRRGRPSSGPRPRPAGDPAGRAGSRRSGRSARRSPCPRARPRGRRSAP